MSLGRHAKGALEPRDCAGFVLKDHAQVDSDYRQFIVQSRSETAQPEEIFGGGGQCPGAGRAGQMQQHLHVLPGVGMVVGEYAPFSRVESSFRQPGEKLVRPGNAAKRYKRPSCQRFWNFRRDHLPPEAPDRPFGAGLETELLKALDCRFVLGWNGQHMRPAERSDPFSQVSCGERPICQVFGVHQHDIDESRQLAVLKAVIEKVDAGFLARIALGESSSLPARGSDIDGNASVSGDQQGFVAELLGGSVDVDSLDRFAAAAVSRERTSTCSPSRWRIRARAMVNGVLPVPPTDRFPTLMTGQRRRFRGRIRCCSPAERRATPAAYSGTVGPARAASCRASLAQDFPDRRDGPSGGTGLLLEDLLAGFAHLAGSVAVVEQES